MAQAEKRYGIGEVQELLKKEFPDITISKIRFLEKEGLIKPERTESGYRKYSRANIKQLGYILRLQREEYLPLSVIKKKIQDLRSGKVVAGDLAVMSGQTGDIAVTDAPVSLDLAPSRLQISQENINELVEYGIVKPREGADGKYFSHEDVKLLMLAREFFRYGVEARHLRMFVQFVGREASFIEQIIRPQIQHKDPNTKRSAIRDLENLIALSQSFVQALLHGALRQYLPRPPAIDFSGGDEEGGSGATASAPGQSAYQEGPEGGWDSGGPEPAGRQEPALSETGGGAGGEEGGPEGRAPSNEAAAPATGVSLPGADGAVRHPGAPSPAERPVTRGREVPPPGATAVSQESPDSEPGELLPPGGGGG